MIIIIVTAFKGAVRDFLQSPHCVANRLQHVHSSGPGANHVQHIERISRATYRVTCHMVRMDSSAIKFDRVLIEFVLLGEIKEGRKLEYPWRRALEKIQAPSKTRTRTMALVTGKESRRANRYTTRHIKSPCK